MEITPLERRRRFVAHAASACVLAAWCAAAPFTPPYLLPSPWALGMRLAEFLGEASMWNHVAASLRHIFVAVTAAILAGGALAVSAHYVPALRLAVHQRICPFLNSFSGTGWVLLAVLWFGLNDITVEFALGMVLVPFAIINLRLGLDSIDPDLVEMARSFGHRGIKRFWFLVLPALVPFLFSTLRICFGVGWKALLTAELFGGSSGFGRLFNLARQDYDTPLVFVVILLIVAFVYGMDRYVFEPIQARLSAHYEIA
jgi:NitT/TauT family transport system permease protein